MHLQALDTIHVSSVSSENITTGQHFEIDDLAGKSLIERGLAIEVDGPPTAKAEPAPEPDAPETNEAAEQPPIANNAGANTRTKVG
ncbi:hypothetical protein ACQKOE_12870 [Novosphingobium sp. NPDC080210]|uniref:hypothetical protein n=1 Tax=Novosphingobium sp. NPDC080210 TaxID=3390596 RepID=UPI003D03FAEA